MIIKSPFVTSSFDSDARAYINTSGATARAEINHFVKAIKRLGLWDSMVCWPLRSSQNAGTGSTAYSLGGLGTYNGTLVNGPTWGADGVLTNGTSNYLTAPILATKNFTSMSVMARTSTSDAGSFPTYWHVSKKTNSPNSWFNDFISYFNDTGLGIFSQISGVDWSPARASGENSTNFGFQTTSMNSVSQVYSTSLNGSFTTRTRSAGFSEDMVEIILGARWSVSYQQFGSGTHAGFLHFNTPLNSSSAESVRTLYKSTLGQGLGLP